METDRNCFGSSIIICSFVQQDSILVMMSKTAKARPQDKAAVMRGCPDSLKPCSHTEGDLFSVELWRYQHQHMRVCV